MVGLGAYAAMKAAQQSMARTWADELAPRRIRVNAISPGIVYTPAYDSAGWSREQAEEAVSLIPAGRLGLEAEVGAAIAFLASDNALFVNGTNLVCRRRSDGSGVTWSRIVKATLTADAR